MAGPQRPLTGALVADAPADIAGLSLDELLARATEASALLKTLAHPARLMLVCTLLEGPMSVGALEERLGVHQPSLSQQLSVLRANGIVRTERVSKQIFYQLTEPKAMQLVQALRAIFGKPGAG